MAMKIPQQSIIYLLICLSGTLIFIFWGIVPSQRTLHELERKIGEAKLRLEEQRTLQSIYQTLKQRAQKQEAQKKDVQALPLPGQGEPVRVQIDQLTEAVKVISGKARVEVVSFVPSLSSLGGNSKSMVMETVVRGEFAAFRKFLIGLGGLPFVSRVEEIRVQQNTEGMELHVRFLVERA